MIRTITVQPGKGGDYPGFPVPTAAAVFYVTSGVMAIAGDVGVRLGSETLPAASSAAGETILGPGDSVALVLGGDRTYAVRNPGTETLAFVEAWVVDGALPLNSLWPVFQEHDDATIRNAQTLPSSATVTVRLTRTTLAIDEEREPAEGGWQVATADATTLSRGPKGAARNVSGKPLEVFFLTAEFAPANAATPAAGTPTA